MEIWVVKQREDQIYLCNPYLTVQQVHSHVDNAQNGK